MWEEGEEEEEEEEEEDAGAGGGSGGKKHGGLMCTCTKSVRDGTRLYDVPLCFIHQNRKPLGVCWLPAGGSCWWSPVFFHQLSPGQRPATVSVSASLAGVLENKAGAAIEIRKASV